MAGKFLSIEETARLLGVSNDEVNRLVDRKKLFPMRDGATLKFKTDEVERLVRTLGEDASSASEALELDLDIAGVAGDDAGGGSADDQLVLDDSPESIFTGPASKGSSTSDTGIGKGSGAAKSGSGLSLAGSASLDNDDLVLGEGVIGDELESDDLSLESIVGSSSPSLGSSPAGSGPLAIELSGIGGGSGPGSGSAKSAPKSGSGIGGLSGPNLGGLSGGLGGSGPSLGDSSLADSGVDLGSAASAAKAAPSGDDFELGGDSTSDEESASVVIASDSEAGDSSFFGQTMSQSSSFGDDSSLGSAGSSEGLVFPTQALEEMSFSVWQIVGLVCCSLLLLFGGFMAYDLVRTIGSPENTSLSNPLLNSLAEVFGWR